MDGPGGKWTVQLGESGRSKAPKVDGPGSKWTVQKEGEVDGPVSERSVESKRSAHALLRTVHFYHFLTTPIF